jgi:alkylated DNA nucleotide flippase Atl1
MAEMEKGRAKHHAGTDSKPFVTSHRPEFLIANLELTLGVSPIGINDLLISNRKYLAIFRSRRCGAAFPLLSLPGFRPQAPSFQNLIENPRLEAKLNPRKISELQISNRERMAVNASRSPQPATHHSPVLRTVPNVEGSHIPHHRISNRNSRITENQSSSSKQRTKQISNRNKNAVVGTPRFSRLGGSRITSHQLRATNLPFFRAYNGDQRLTQKCPS